jgi:hypothetical protein
MAAPGPRSQHELRAVASMVVASLPFPPLPVMVLQGEDGADGIASSFDLLHTAVMNAQLGLGPADRDAEALARSKQATLERLQADMAALYVEADWKNATDDWALVQRAYETYCAAFRTYLLDHYGTSSRDLRFYPLAAVALLEVADDLRKANKLADAAKAYEAAGKAVVGESKAVKAIATRARLYAALTRQELGQADAEAGIIAVAEDNSAPDTLRGYAMYVLANLALAKGDSATAAKWVNLMDKRLKPNHVWASDKSWLVRSEPSLLTPVSAPPALPAGK